MNNSLSFIQGIWIWNNLFKFISKVFPDLSSKIVNHRCKECVNAWSVRHPSPLELHHFNHEEQKCGLKLCVLLPQSRNADQSSTAWHGYFFLTQCLEETFMRIKSKRFLESNKNEIFFFSKPYLSNELKLFTGLRTRLLLNQLSATSSSQDS